MKRISAATCAVLLMGVGSLTAQSSDTIMGNRLLAHPVLHPPFADTIRVGLHKHGQYRILVWPAETQLRIVSARHPGDAAFSTVVRAGSGSAPAVVELYPQDDGDHFIVATPPQAAGVARVWVWEDSTAETVALEKRERHAIVGFTIASGYLSGYTLSVPNTPVDSSGAAGYVEAGLIVGSPTGVTLLIGYGHDRRSVPGDSNSVGWVYFEGRGRFAHTQLAGRELDLTAVLRYGRSFSDPLTADPDSYGGGLSVNWHLDHQTGNRGLAIGANALYSAFSMAGTSLVWVTRGGISLTWYP